LGFFDCEPGEEGRPRDDEELSALGEELDADERPPLRLVIESVLVRLLVEFVLVESVLVELDVSEPCENVPRLVVWSRVSSSASLLKTRRAVGAATPLAFPLPPPEADRPASDGAASEDDVDSESRAAAPLPPAEAVEGDESETAKAAPLPVPVDDDRASADSGAEGFASEVPSVLPPLAIEVVLCADLSELAVAP
jgi:hypothetical protein